MTYNMRLQDAELVDAWAWKDKNGMWYVVYETHVSVPGRKRHTAHLLPESWVPIRNIEFAYITRIWGMERRINETLQGCDFSASWEETLAYVVRTIETGKMPCTKADIKMYMDKTARWKAKRRKKMPRERMA